MLTGYSAKGGGFRNALSALRTAGHITRTDPVTATPEGLAGLGDGWEPLPTGPALLDHWTSQLGRAESAILRTLIDAYPHPMTKEAIAAATDYSAEGGGFRNALSRLRTLQLIDGYDPVTADPTLATAVKE